MCSLKLLPVCALVNEQSLMLQTLANDNVADACFLTLGEYSMLDPYHRTHYVIFHKLATTKTVGRRQNIYSTQYQWRSTIGWQTSIKAGAQSPTLEKSCDNTSYTCLVVLWSTETSRYFTAGDLLVNTEQFDSFLVLTF